MKKRLFLLIMVCLLALCACGKGDDEDGGEDAEEAAPLRTYTFGGDQAVAFDAILTEHEKLGGMRAAVVHGSELSDVENDDAGSEASGESGLPESVTYDYLKLNDAGLAVKYYVAELTRTDPPFAIHGEEPDYTASHGTIVMMRNAQDAAAAAEDEDEDDKKSKDKDKDKDQDNEDEDAEEDTSANDAQTLAASTSPVRRFQITLEWGESNCIVTLSMVEQEGLSSSMTDPPLSYAMAKDMMHTVTPSELGLPGSSMNEYEIVPGPGLVSVDGEACLKVNVYGTSDEGTNVIAGTYFISERTHELYQQVGDSSSVEKIELTADVPVDYEPPATEDGEESENGESDDDDKDSKDKD